AEQVARQRLPSLSAGASALSATRSRPSVMRRWVVIRLLSLRGGFAEQEADPAPGAGRSHPHGSGWFVGRSTCHAGVIPSRRTGSGRDGRPRIAVTTLVKAAG